MQELLADFEDLDELYRCYMPFLKSGGILSSPMPILIWGKN